MHDLEVLSLCHTVCGMLQLQPAAAVTVCMMIMFSQVAMCSDRPVLGVIAPVSLEVACWKASYTTTDTMLINLTGCNSSTANSTGQQNHW